jgi:hypothetical protein
MNIEDYCVERDKAVGGSFEDFKIFAAKQGQQFTSDEVAEIAYHKCRTAITSMPNEIRNGSKSWLLERGCTDRS